MRSPAPTPASALRRPRARRAGALTVVAVFAIGLAVPASAQGDPWQALATLRQRLEGGGAQSWSFQQTYVPAGFSSGEREAGRLILGLPRCVRWDYHEPYPKSFLLCGSELHAWNRGEPVGQLYTLEEAQPGLDLLLLPVEVLRLRYDAELEPLGSGAQRIALAPRGEASHLLRAAELVLAPGGERLQRLSYRDQEGNRTTFDFGNPRAHRGRRAFTPPAGVRWERQGS